MTVTGAARREAQHEGKGPEHGRQRGQDHEHQRGDHSERCVLRDRVDQGKRQLKPDRGGDAGDDRHGGRARAERGEAHHEPERDRAGADRVKTEHEHHAQARLASGSVLHMDIRRIGS